MRSVLRIIRLSLLMLFGAFMGILFAPIFVENRTTVGYARMAVICAFAGLAIGLGIEFVIRTIKDDGAA
jgi:hypothetical protein